MLAKKVFGIASLGEYNNGIIVNSCRFLKKNLNNAVAWENYKKELEKGNKYYVDSRNRFFVKLEGDSNLCFVGDSVDDVIEFLLWE